MTINETLKARSLFHCDNSAKFERVFEHDPMWRQNVAGCFVLQLLKEMYKFKYVYFTVYDLIICLFIIILQFGTLL